MTMRRTGDVRCRGVSRIMSGYPRIYVSRDVPGYPAFCCCCCCCCILVIPEYTTLMSTVHHSHEVHHSHCVHVCKSVPPSHFAEMLSKNRESYILLRTPPLGLAPQRPRFCK
jgi:hypothetical protein